MCYYGCCVGMWQTWIVLVCLDFGGSVLLAMHRGEWPALQKAADVAEAIVTRPASYQACMCMYILHLVAVNMGSPRGGHRTLCNPALHLSSDINQHLVHATTLANAKSLQDRQDALACLPALVSNFLLLRKQATLYWHNQDVVKHELDTGVRARVNRDSMPVRGQVLSTDEH